MRAEVDFASALMCLTLLTATCLTLLLVRVPAWVRALSTFVLFLRVTFAVANLEFGWLVTPDATTYHRQAVALSEGYDPAMFVAGKEAWPTILSVLYGWSSASPVIPLGVNAALCALMVPLVFWIAEVAVPGAGTPAVWLLLLMPGWWIWSLTGLREPLVWLLSLVALAGLLLTVRRGSHWGLVAFVVVVTLFAWVRGPLALVLGVAGAASLILARRPSLGRIVGLVLAVPVVIVLVVPQLQQIAALREGTTTLIKNELSGAGSGFDVSNPVMVAARVMTGPWPWETRTLGLFIVPEMLYLWLVLVLLLSGIRAVRATAAIWLLPALGIVASLVVTSGNYGTLIRLRTQALVWLVPLLGCGWVMLRRRAAARSRGGPVAHTSAVELRRPEGAHDGR